MLFHNINIMTRQISQLLVLNMMILMIAWVPVRTVYAQFDFNAFLGNTIMDEEIDGIIGSEWDDAGNYQNISIEPQTTAEIWSKHDGVYLYLAMQFTADSSDPWVAFHFDYTAHMSPDADGALFGHNRLAANEYRDISFGGLGVILADESQDGVGAIRLDNQNLVTVELKKPLKSGDSAGKDISWDLDTTYPLIIRWDSNGGGSSGGSRNHWNSPLEYRTIFINTNEIPEFSGLNILVVLVAMAILVIILNKKTSLRISESRRLSKWT